MSLLTARTRPAAVFAVLVLIIAAIAVATPAHAADPGPRYRIRLDLAGCGTLQTGARGPCVRSLQTWLNLADNADLVIDGRFGTGTRNAVIDFQRRFGVSPTGRFGPASRAALRTWYREMTEEVAPDAKTGARVEAPLRCQDPASTDVCNERRPVGEPSTDMGRSLLKSLVCTGAGLVVGRISVFAGIVAGVVCDVFLDRAVG